MHTKQPPNNRDRLSFFMKSVEFMFERQQINHFIDVGTCYHKESIVCSRSWIYTEMFIVNGSFIFYDCDQVSAKCLDLRKVRKIELRELDNSVINVSWENRLYIAIDCVTGPLFVARSSEDNTKTLCNDLTKLMLSRTRRNLEDQQLTKDNVPVVMETCMNFIYAHGLKSEGIYRISGHHNNVAKLTALFNKNAHSVMLRYSEYDEHDVASTMKQFFRTMSTPLLDRQSVAFLAVSDLEDEAIRKETYKELLTRLSVIQYQTLRRLIGHLHAVQLCSEQNKMSAVNLSKFWGRNILVDMTQVQCDFLQKEHRVTYDLILWYNELFNTSEKERVSNQLSIPIFLAFTNAIIC
jgi:Arf-GAP with Rho-GAP domain, ANK repeat and PH domain-containing protein 1